MSQLSKGSNSINYQHRAEPYIEPTLVPYTVTNNDGVEEIVYKPMKHSDFGTLSDYQLEELRKAGITPNSISIGASSRLSVADEFNAFEKAADHILTSNNE